VIGLINIYFFKMKSRVNRYVPVFTQRHQLCVVVNQLKVEDGTWADVSVILDVSSQLVKKVYVSIAAG